MNDKEYRTIRVKLNTHRLLRKRKLIMDANRPTDKPLSWDEFLDYLSRRHVE